MDETLDKTALTTLSLLEARLLRLEYLIFGPAGATSTPTPVKEPAVATLGSLERRFSTLLTQVRVYAELLKIYKAHPALFHAPPPSEPPEQLSPEAIRATVLSYASAFPSTVSALTAATADTPVPDAASSAALVALLPRLHGLDATRRAQEAEVAALRARSEAVVRAWYEGRVLGYSAFVADVEGRVERVERTVRRAEKARERASQGEV